MSKKQRVGKKCLENGSTKVCIILSKPELGERRRERGNARGGATKKRGFHSLPDSEIYTSEYTPQ